MDTAEIIDQSLAAVSTAGLDHRASGIAAERERLLAPRYRVAFVGQFKTGKSTLINRLILKGDILFTDIMEATSIPVEIDYADTPRLELYRYEKAAPSDDPSGEYVTGIASAPERTIDHPTPEQIRQATSGDTAEDRVRLASTYSHARLLWPAPNLRQFTVVDTPGINTPNEAVATTTYRILPECDLAIFVAPPRQLSSVDLQFLKGRVFEPGIARVLVVLHYDPRFTDLSSGHLQNITEEIQATLANIGRPSIPVTVAELAREGAGAPGDLGKSLVGTDPLDDWLGSSSTPSPVPSSTVPDLEAELVRFIRENIRPGKEEKIRARLRRHLEGALAECQVELGLLEQDEQTRRETVETIRHTQQEAKRQHDDIREDVLNDLHHLQTTHLAHLWRGFDRIEQKFGAEVEGCENLNQVQNRLKSSKPILQMEVEALALDTRKAIASEVERLEKTYAFRLRETSQHWRDLDIALKIDGGLLEKMPSFLVLALDVFIVSLLSPFPIFVDLPLRFLAAGMPGLQKLLPAALAAEALKKWVTSSVSEQFTRAKEEIKEKLAEAYTEAEVKLTRQWDALAVEQERTIGGAVDRSLHPADPARAGVLREAVATLKRLLAELPSSATHPLGS